MFKARGHVAGTHGDILNVHTEAFWTLHTGACQEEGKGERDGKKGEKEFSRAPKVKCTSASLGASTRVSPDAALLKLPSPRS